MIEIGEYARMKSGEILKITGTAYEIDDYKIYKTDRNYTIVEDEIKSYSKNITDVIEEGDLIRYQLKDISSFKDIGTIRMLIDEEDGGENTIATGVLGNRVLENVKILSILTHEQYEKNCYRVEE